MIQGIWREADYITDTSQELVVISLKSLFYAINNVEHYLTA